MIGLILKKFIAGKSSVFVWVTIAVLVMSLVGGALFYYYSTQRKITNQAKEIATLQINVQEKKAIIEQKDKELRQQRLVIRKLNKEFADAREQVDKLRSKFNKLGNASKITRDLGKLAIAKPKLIERAINNGTQDALRCVEIISGAELTDVEKKATKRSEINSACPEIANPNYLLH